MNLEIKHLWSHKCPKKWDQYTLVALVITIIILLILAGVAIAQLSDSGLFKKSQESKQKWEVAQADENEKIAKYTNEMDSYISGNRSSSTFTKLYDGISANGSYTLTDSIDKYDKLLFLIGNPTSNLHIGQHEVYTKFIKDNYGTVANKFQCSSYDNLYINYHFTDSKTFVIDGNNLDTNHKIIGIYGVN